MPIDRGLAPEFVRSWLGLYVLLLTACVGAWILMAPKVLMPLDSPERVAAAEIVIPFLLGQVAAVFRYYSAAARDRRKFILIPRWVVQAPPLIVSVIIGLQFLALAIGGLKPELDITPSPDSFRAVLAFGVALLNASTVFVMTRYFESKASPSDVTDPSE